MKIPHTQLVEELKKLLDQGHRKFSVEYIAVDEGGKATTLFTDDIIVDDNGNLQTLRTRATGVEVDYSSGPAQGKPLAEVIAEGVHSQEHPGTRKLWVIPQGQESLEFLVEDAWYLQSPNWQ
ncbi:MAG: hypothetical protein COY40_00690 [Alphaproteobacteria bacterium CG_4_10_14_0_8_um_filter_53_9]|nr:MAG: hypothetical protein COY40_00690 [Alphaproteobacteria bacterium CG_4_10_14_0_8_um_filter_53_9]